MAAPVVPPTPILPPVVQAPVTTPHEMTRNTRVGFLAPLSGPTAPVGQALLRAAQMAFFDLAGDDVVLIPRDTGDTPDGAANAANQVLAEGASLILGPLFATGVPAVAGVARATNVPVITFSNDRNVAGQNVYLVGIAPEPQVTRIVEFAAKRGLTRVAALAPSTPYGDRVLDTFGKAVAANGGQLAGTARVGAAATPDELGRAAKSLAATEAAAPAQALFLPLQQPLLRALVPQLAASGLDPAKTRLLGTAVWEGASLGSEPALIGAWYAGAPDVARAEFERRYAGLYGDRPPRVATLGYDAAALAAVIAREGKGGFDLTTLRNRQGFAGLDGVFRFAPDGTAERGLAVLEVTGGGARVIDPAPDRFDDAVF